MFSMMSLLPCIMSAQHIRGGGGRGGEGGISTSGNTMSTSGGYHEYDQGIS